MTMQKRNYDPAFKQEALRLLASSGKSVRAIEDELGITPGLLNKWKKRYRLNEVGAVQSSEQHALVAENRALRRELEVVRGERELLKKTLLLFAQDAR